MDQIDKDKIIKDIPLFSALSPEDLKSIRDSCQIVEYKKGQVIYAQQAPVSCFYCIILGRVVIFTYDEHGDEIQLEHLHRGKYFGIISLLTGEPHSVTARALNDCLILEIKKDDFDQLLKKLPGLAIDLSRTLSRRLKNKDLHPKTVFESTVISIFSSYSQSGKSIYALNLALGLSKQVHKPLIILDICSDQRRHSLASRLDLKEQYQIFDLCSSSQYHNIKDAIVRTNFGIDIAFFHYQPQQEQCVGKLVDVMNFLVNDYNYVVLDLPSIMDDFVFRVLNQSDALHLLTSPDPVDLKKTRNLIDHLREKFEFPEDKIKVVINEYKLAKIAYLEQAELLEHNIFATLPRIGFSASERLILDAASSEYSQAVRRICRQVGETQVGLALGVGVAYGFCHVGVLKVIEEENIPIDVISGASMGAVIAGLWAMGKSSQEILQATEDFKDPRYIWEIIDLTLPLVAFVKGKKLYAFLKKHFGNKTFYDLRLPLKIVASDVKRKQPKVIEKGLLADAIMASCSMPGIFRPFLFKGEVLFDGGLIHPVPTEPLFSAGVKKIIAVNVTPSKEDLASSAAIDKPVKRSWFNLGQYYKDRMKMNIFNAVFSSIEFMQSELAQREGKLADIILHPDTKGLHWMELSRAQDFVKRGEEEARRNLDKILQLVNE
ncbi:MAG: cyclic nucleotide-binding domain-containing protein [Candidatus Omnitrophica bacterium]|jgi:NTE family protein|nr:cyclic nucleotide-binding domain-containing protein [Candidatus Omnitrophota bacterium]